MRNLKGGSVDTGQQPPKFEGFEQRLLDELKLMVTERRVDAADPAVSVSAGRPPIRMPAWRRAGLVAAAGLAVGALTVTSVFAGGLIGSGPAPAGGAHIELTSFLAKAAAAARKHPAKPVQADWIFVSRVKAGDTGPKTDNKVRCFIMTYDTPATGRGSFPTRSGPCRDEAALFKPHSSEVGLANGRHSGITTKSGPVTHGYPNPATLPTSPKALLAALNRDAAKGHWGIQTTDLTGAGTWSSDLPRNGVVFGLIERLLQIPIPPRLVAALFEVTGRLPGVTLDRHATDLIGRRGVGISLALPTKNSANGLSLEFVLNPKKGYNFLGSAFVDRIGHPAHPQKFGYAVMESYLAGPAATTPPAPGH